MWKSFKRGDLARLGEGRYYNVIAHGVGDEPVAVVVKFRNGDLVEPTIDLVLFPESIIKINTTPLDKDKWASPFDCDWRTLADGEYYNVYGLVTIFAEEDYMCVQKIQGGLMNTANGIYITKIVKICPRPVATHKQIYGE